MRYHSAPLLRRSLPSFCSCSGRCTVPDHRVEPPPVGATFTADILRDLPLGDNIYALLETTQADVIAGSVQQRRAECRRAITSRRVSQFVVADVVPLGDLNVSDPNGGGALLFPEALPWQRVRVDTGLMPADLNSSGPRGHARTSPPSVADGPAPSPAPDRAAACRPVRPTISRRRLPASRSTRMVPAWSRTDQQPAGTGRRRRVGRLAKPQPRSLRRRLAARSALASRT